MAIENFDPKEWSKQFLGNLEPGGHCICDGSRENGWQEIHVNPLCPVHGNATNVATECTCPTWPGTPNRIVTAPPNPLCPVHGNATNVATEPEYIEHTLIWVTDSARHLSAKCGCGGWKIEVVGVPNSGSRKDIETEYFSHVYDWNFDRDNAEEATEPECICIHRFLSNGIRHVQQAHPLCPIHGDVRDTGIIELCDLCGRPLGNGDYGGVHSTCADAENAQP